MLATWGTSTGRNPTLDLQFAGATSLDNRITFSRGTTATYFNSAGVLTTAGTAEARFDYNPSTLAPRGLLIEEQRTNSIRNNTMQGAVAGTPGTLPTNWQQNSGTVAVNVVGTGTENGITYIDLQFVGTPSTTFANIRFDTNTQIVAANGQAWTSSFFVRRVAGSTANITDIDNRVYFRDVGGNGLQEAGVSVLSLLSNSSLNNSKTTNSLTAANVSIARVNNGISLALTVGAAIDITLRIGLPQLEQGAFATSVIPTTTTALTRNADVASMTGTNFSSWFNATEGTLLAQVIYGADVNCKTAFINNGAYTNLFSMQREGSLDRWQVDVFSGGSRQALLTFATNSAAINSVSKCASAYKVDDFSGSVNGGTVVTDTSGLVPVSMDRLALGRDNVGSAEFLNGWLQRISYYPVRLSNSTLQALTT